MQKVLPHRSITHMLYSFVVLVSMLWKKIVTMVKNDFGELVLALRTNQIGRITKKLYSDPSVWNHKITKSQNPFKKILNVHTALFEKLRKFVSALMMMRTHIFHLGKEPRFVPLNFEIFKKKPTRKIKLI